MKSDVLEFLESRKGRVFSVKEVSKELDPQRYETDRTWAWSELKKLCTKGLIEPINGCYWVPNEEEKSEEAIETVEGENQDQGNKAGSLADETPAIPPSSDTLVQPE